MKKTPAIFKLSVPRLKVAVLYSGLPSSADPLELASEEETVDTAREVVTALNSLGHQTILHEVNEQNVSLLGKDDKDLYFNLCENGTDFLVADYLSQKNKNFTGSPVETLRLTTNKADTKEVLIKHGLKTPKHHLYSTPKEVIPNGFKFPVIIKPVSEDASIGLTQKSIVHNYAELKSQVEAVVEKYRQPALAEEYIKGREFLITVIGNNGDARVLPFVEVDFGPYFKDKYAFQTYAVKWGYDSPEFQNTTLRCPAIDLSWEVAQKMAEMSLRAFHLTGCRGYARVDFRLDEKLEPYILEVNANPSLEDHPQTPVARASLAEGLTYPQLIDKIAKLALTT